MIKMNEITVRTRKQAWENVNELVPKSYGKDGLLSMMFGIDIYKAGNTIAISDFTNMIEIIDAGISNTKIYIKGI